MQPLKNELVEFTLIVAFDTCCLAFAVNCKNELLRYLKSQLQDMVGHNKPSQCGICSLSNVNNDKCTVTEFAILPLQVQIISTRQSVNSVPSSYNPGSCQEEAAPHPLQYSTEEQHMLSVALPFSQYMGRHTVPTLLALVLLAFGIWLSFMKNVVMLYILNVYNITHSRMLRGLCF